MRYVDLKRSFVLIGKDQEASLDLDRTWGRRIGGWLDWQDLLEHRRVVLLAEALSGKTEEFRHQAATLANQGKAAFFVRIEDLADDGFEAALDRAAVEAFKSWHKDAAADGWFFLDSVDEARLNRKRLDKALRRFERELDPGLERARVLVSCRVSDWRGQEDREEIEHFLPVRRKRAARTLDDDDAELLAPIFPEDYETASLSQRDRHEHGLWPSRQPERKLDTLAVVQLVPLTAEQRRSLAEAAGIDRPGGFVEEIERQGLDKLAERPGDLLDLVGYRRTKGRFGSLVEMTEYGVSRKLEDRRDKNDLSSRKARLGAESLAAALTLAKTFALRAPGHDPDPTLAVGALDSAHVLDDWTNAERDALLRRGLFAPSTYGRIRFHHRGTQEYLMARWLHRILRGGSARTAVWEFIFAERYGVETLVPSLHAVAAWLALDHPDIRDEIIRREPMVLLRHGDPRSLPLKAKENLLLEYATRDLAAELSSAYLDYRRLWMFATPDLADAIHQSWEINHREDFRMDLLCLVREGPIPACAQFARGVALDETRSDFLRIVALQALAACGETEGLIEAARWLKSASGEVSVRLGSGFATVLFPHHIRVEELLQLIEHAPVPPHGPAGGYGHVVEEFWRACPDAVARERFIARLADLSLSRPFMSDYRRISARHHGLAEALAPIAREAVLGLGDAEPSEGLIRMLMAVERTEGSPSNDLGRPSLNTLVSEKLSLQRHLFWADIEETRQNTGGADNRPTNFWQARLRLETLWQLGSRDLVWLYEDLPKRSLLADQQVAFSAIIHVLRDIGNLEAEMPQLHALVSGSVELERMLDGVLTPFEESEVGCQIRRNQRHEEKIAKKKQEAKASWIRFREELEADPSMLADPALIANRNRGAVQRWELTRWLRRKTKKGYEEAALQWPLLEEGFSPTVAQAYRNGMKALWRLTSPERPKRKGNRVITKHVTLFAYAGLAIEAGEAPEWAHKLSPAEAERAAQHACLSEQGYPDWFEKLTDRHPATVLPILRQTLRDEWAGRYGGRSEFLSHYGFKAKQIHKAVHSILFEVITGKKPKALNMLDCGREVLVRLKLTDPERRRATALALRRLRAARAAADDEPLWRYFGWLFFLDADRAVHELIEWLDAAPRASRDARTESTVAALFGLSGFATGALATVSVESLEALLRLTDRYVRPEDDSSPDGRDTPDTRDQAERAREVLLKALIDRPGAAAYHAMRAVSAAEISKARSVHLGQLTHGKAEHDAELPAWSPTEVLHFERHLIAPAKTGEALLRVVLGVLSDIQNSFRRADTTSRRLLEPAKNEREIQEWLTEQLELRSEGRYHAHREAQIADGDKPDIIVSSTTASVEVAIEMKHGGMPWTVRQLESALTKQLAAKYLKPAERRWGVLVVTHHGRFRCGAEGVRTRTWRDPGSGATLTFHDLIRRLEKLASRVVKNKFGHVEVRAIGIDAAAHQSRPRRGQRHGNRV